MKTSHLLCVIIAHLATNIVVPCPVGPPAGPLQPVAPPNVQSPRLATNLNTNVGSGYSDQEKAALIVQVLQKLSDEQIAMLPPEQRQSILILKEQIAKSTQR